MRIELNEKDIKTALEDYILKHTGCKVAYFDNNWRITRGNKDNIESVGIGCELKDKYRGCNIEDFYNMYMISSKPLIPPLKSSTEGQSSMGEGIPWSMDLEKQKITEKVLNIVALNLGVKRDIITLDSNKDSLCIDSLDELEIIMSIEDEFDTEIKDSEAERLNTVEDLVNLVFRLVKGE